MKFSRFSLVVATATFVFPALACPPDGESVEKVVTPEEVEKKEEKTEKKATTEKVEKTKEVKKKAPPKKVETKEEKTGLPEKPEKPGGLRILIAGGGYSPSGNQISLESNVKYFRRVLDMLGLGEAKTHTLFADGRDKGRDLQYADPAFRIPEMNRVLAELIGSTRGLQNQYRTNNLEPDGPALIADLDKWFDATAKDSGDGVLLYFTGHGGKGDKKTPDNTTANLWNGQKVKVRDLVKRLNKLPKEKPVILVMVQCYSGGFANVIFKDGDPKKGISDHARAGFFATVQDRVAAGCTPDIREENYREYSTSFWEALCGESRVGKTVDKPDFDGDGRTSYAEAHAHVILTSNTIDVPVKTTDAFLRRFSKTAPPKKSTPDKKEDANATAAKKCGEEAETSEDWLTVETDFEKIIEHASTVERATLEGLSAKLGLKGEKRAKAARDLSKKLEEQRKKLAEQKKKPAAEIKRIKTKLSSEIRKRWPEVGNPYHPTARALFEPERAKEVLALVKRDGEWGKYRKAKGEISGLDKKRFELDRKKVKCMRFLRALENVVLEANLPLVAKDDVLKRFEKLRALENETLGGKTKEANPG